MKRPGVAGHLTCRNADDCGSPYGVFITRCEGLDPAKCTRKLACAEINEACRKNLADCPSSPPASRVGQPPDAPCCRRNDKSRCVHCFVYVNFIHWTETGDLQRTMQTSLPEIRQFPRPAA